jgi:dihydrolipoamide dehydrogenase
MNTPPNTHFDVIVIGSGPAGYTAAIGASMKGAKTALVEAAALGGTCLNRGCIPTKFFWEALHLRKKISKAASYGIAATLAPAEFSAAKNKKDKTIAQLATGMAGLCKNHGVTVVTGSAKFIDKNTIVAAETTYTSTKFIIATGSSPREVSGITIDHSSILDSTDLLALETLPSSMLIVGRVRLQC